MPLIQTGTRAVNIQREIKELESEDTVQGGFDVMRLRELRPATTGLYPCRKRSLSVVHKNTILAIIRFTKEEESLYFDYFVAVFLHCPSLQSVCCIAPVDIFHRGSSDDVFTNDALFPCNSIAYRWETHGTRSQYCQSKP